MPKQLYMVAQDPLIFGTVEGPGHYLNTGEKILASRVNEAFLDDVKAGRRKADLVEIDDDSDPKPPDGGTTQPQADTPAGKTDDDNTGEAFDPTQYKVDEVLAYLKTASADEVARVKEAEAAGSSRAGGPSKRVADFVAS